MALSFVEPQVGGQVAPIAVGFAILKHRRTSGGEGRLPLMVCSGTTRPISRAYARGKKAAVSGEVCREGLARCRVALRITLAASPARKGELSCLRRRASFHFPRPLPESSTGLRVRPYIPGDEASLVEMYSAIFRERSLAEWRWLFEQGPEGPALIGVLEHDGRPVGSIAHIPTSVWVDGRRLRLATGCDLMVSPECRGRGGSQQLVETFLESDHGFDLNLGHVNDRSGHVFTEYAGTVRLGELGTGSATTIRTRGFLPRSRVRYGSVGRH